MLAAMAGRPAWPDAGSRRASSSPSAKAARRWWPRGDGRAVVGYSGMVLLRRTPVCIVGSVKKRHPSSNGAQSRRAVEALALFDQGWTALQRLLPGYTGSPIYLCPLCLRGFYKHQVGERGLDIPYLDREHAPQRFRDPHRPAACLTCRTCNSAASKFESTAGRHANEMEKLRMGHRARFPGHIDGRAGWVDLERVGDRHLHVHTPFSTVLGLDVGMRDAEHSALVKSAICIGFANLGYSFVLCTELDEVRETAAGRSPMSSKLAWFLRERTLDDQLLVAEEPFPAVVVVVSGRVVLLPRHGSPADFGAAVRKLEGSPISFGGPELYPLVPSKLPDRMPMHWDRCGRPHPRCGCPKGLVEDRPA